MGIVIRLPRHVRTASSLREASPAKTSNVISVLPRSAAKATTAPQCGAGMPRRRQPLTTDRCWPNASATAPSDPGGGGEPPQRSSMTESHDVMEPKIVCTVQTSQGFATRKTTFHTVCDEIEGMIDPPHVVAGRLEALRKELKIEKEHEFAEAIGLDKSTYSSIKNGHRNLSFETACLMRHKWGLSIDWIFYGDIQQTAIQIMTRIGRGTPFQPPMAPKRTKPRKRKAG